MRTPIYLTVFFLGAAWLLQAPYGASAAAQSMNVLLWLFAAIASGLAWLTWYVTRDREGWQKARRSSEDA